MLDSRARHWLSSDYPGTQEGPGGNCTSGDRAESAGAALHWVGSRTDSSGRWVEDRGPATSEERTGVMNDRVRTENESELRRAEERGVRPGFRAQKMGSNSWLGHLRAV